MLKLKIWIIGLFIVFSSTIKARILFKNDTNELIQMKIILGKTSPLVFAFSSMKSGECLLVIDSDEDIQHLEISFEKPQEDLWIFGVFFKQKIEKHICSDWNSCEKLPKGVYEIIESTSKDLDFKFNKKYKFSDRHSICSNVWWAN